MTHDRTLWALAAAACAIVAASQADAHAKLVAANPAANAATAAPRTIVLTFSETLQPRFSGFEVSKGGVRVPVKVSTGKDRHVLVGAPVKPLTPGAYQVAWHAVTSDTHRMQGAYGFRIR